MNRRSSKGISDVVATVIIVAATVAIALVAVAYFTGIVGGSTGSQRISLNPISRICVNATNQKNTYLYLKIDNTGSKSVEITGIQISGHYIDLSSNPITVPAGSSYFRNITNIYDKVGINFTAGSTYTIQFYTSGNVKLLSQVIQAYSIDDCSGLPTATTTSFP
ncbi:MAG: hypothetical protein F7B59_02245 [Desulfurococcales archaeon]|nr:hypothetical protein [Desulfurococcales archaeon]